jgi:SPX domain protein involved in polyphosphate accumulation
MELLVEEKVAARRIKVKQVEKTGDAVAAAKAVYEPVDYRFERKFFVSDLTKREILDIIRLHPAMFAEIYHERFVNNIYFDTLTFDNYFAAMDGLAHREKNRIRWYGDLVGPIGKPVLERKIKDGMVGRKENYPLVPFALDENYTFNTSIEVFKNSVLPEKLKIELMALLPTLFNRYRRRYFQSANRRYRITLDTDLEFYRPKPYDNTFLGKWTDRENVIVELKYANAKDSNADLISRHFPFRVTKSSKYCMGIDRFYL